MGCFLSMQATQHFIAVVLITAKENAKLGETKMRNSVLSALVFLLLTPVLFGQAFTSLSGVVTDPSGGVVPGATIVIVNTQTNVQRETTSNEEGRYSFPQILPGTYVLTAKMAKFTSVEVKDIVLQVNSPVTINVKFEKVGGTSETVTVTAAATLVNTTDASLGNAITSSTILQLPSYARNVVNLLQLQPGVTENGQVNGGKSDQANVTLDGVDVNDQVNRSAFTSVLRVTLDSVEEFRTTTTGQNVDQGRGSGAEVALVTKSGTNNYHGSLYEYNRNEKFAANDFFSNRAGIARPALKINIFGGSFSGPILKDRLFLFANYEGRRDASAQSLSRTVPTDDLRNGIVNYHDLNGNLRKIGPADIKLFADPAGIGVDANSLAVFNMYPKGNVPDSGDHLNTISYQFNAPRHAKTDTYIARLDFTVDNAGKHQLFARGNLQNDHTGGVPQFPGMPPASEGLANNKGIATGYTWVIRPNIVNSLRYGLTRQGGESTGQLNSPYTSFRGYATIYSTSSASKRIVPVHTINEDFSWNWGKHDFRFGGIYRAISNQSAANGNTFHSATTNASGLAGSGSFMYQNIPGGLLRSDTTSYTYAMDALLGLISQINANYQYFANPDGTTKVIPQGDFVVRNFVNHEGEMYAQDSWKIRHNFTITGGIRYSLMPAVYEANGQQVSPQIPLADWLGERGALAAQGLPQSQAEAIQYVLASSPQGRGLYSFLKHWSPRLGLAYSPGASSGLGKLLFGGPGKTSFRAGFGLSYDLIGQPLANTFNSNAFGLSNRLTNPLNTLDAFTAPRFTSFWSIPTAQLPAPPPANFPVTFPDLFSITSGLDDKLNAPYTMNMNFSWGREFGKGWFVQASYVGRLSRHSLIQRDLAMPTNLKDPKSGLTYFQAMQQLGTQLEINGVPYAQLPAIAYFENLWPGAAGNGMTATQVIGKYYWENSNPGDWTNVLYGMDNICNPSGTTFRSSGAIRYLGCSKFGPAAMMNGQYGALSGWSSIGFGDYHGAQFTISKRFSQSLQFDFNYTLSKSIDLGSSAESAGAWSGTFVTNSWDPGQQRSVSDYDTLHSVNALWTWRLPVGRGMKYGSGMSRLLDAIVGGWQVAGTYRQTSARPYDVSTGSVWPTNWQLSNPAVPTGLPFPTVSVNKNGTLPDGTSYPSMFATQADSEAAVKAYRQSFPGEYGLRNNIRITGNFDISTNVSKEFKMPYKEGHIIQIRWETYNLTNSAILSGPDMDMTSTPTFGSLTSQRNDPRQMQFAIRYQF